MRSPAGPILLTGYVWWCSASGTLDVGLGTGPRGYVNVWTDENGNNSLDPSDTHLRIIYFGDVCLG